MLLHIPPKNNKRSIARHERYIAALAIRLRKSSRVIALLTGASQGAIADFLRSRRIAPGRRLHERDIPLVLRLFAEGAGNAEIERRVGFSIQSLDNLLARHGVARPVRARRRALDPGQVRHLYAAGWSQAQVAWLLGYSVRYLNSYMKKHGIASRPRGRPARAQECMHSVSSKD